MKHRVLGRTGLHVSEIGFGAWAIGGNKYGNSYGSTDDDTSMTLKHFLSKNARTLTQSALKFVLEEKAVSTVIPGAKTESQVEENLSASDREGLTETEIAELIRIFRQ